MSSVPLCCNRPRLASEPLVDPLWVERETGARTFDCMEEGVFVGWAVEVLVAVAVGVEVEVGVRVAVAVGRSGVFVGVLVAGTDVLVDDAVAVFVGVKVNV